jgi:UDPglucose 6-dehydrogenase
MAEEGVCDIGIWHLGAVTSVCPASPGRQVISVDNGPDRVKELNRGTPPLFEPGLAELLSENVAAGRLQYTTELETAVRHATYVLFTFDTPVDERDEVHLSELFAAYEAAAQKRVINPL